MSQPVSVSVEALLAGTRFVSPSASAAASTRLLAAMPSGFAAARSAVGASLRVLRDFERWSPLLRPAVAVAAAPPATEADELELFGKLAAAALPPPAGDDELEILEAVGELAAVAAASDRLNGDGVARLAAARSEVERLCASAGAERRAERVLVDLASVFLATRLTTRVAGLGPTSSAAAVAAARSLVPPQHLSSSCWLRVSLGLQAVVTAVTALATKE
jgi:hypothetical protein